MNFDPSAFAIGGLAFGSVIVACWSKIKDYISKLISCFYITVVLEDEIQKAIQYYCWNHMKRSMLGMSRYSGRNFFIKKTDQYETVLWERIPYSGISFWKGLRFINISFAGGSMNISYIRGMWNIEKFMREAIDLYRVKTSSVFGKSRRFFIYRRFGNYRKTLAKEAARPVSNESPSNAAVVDDLFSPLTSRLVGKFNDEDISANVNFEKGKALDSLCLTREAMDVVNEIKFWLKSKDWYKSKCLSWRRGVLLHGKTGSGKTSLVRSIAIDLDLPIIIFDLSSMSNEEFLTEWEFASSFMPCIFLFEDIDNIWDGRTNKSDTLGGGITFDCFLNAISGIESTNGLLLFITTNNLDSIDPALGIEDDIGVSTRPGRIDRVVELGYMSEKCKISLIDKFLDDYPEDREEMIKSTKGIDMTPAQLQEMCSSIALKRYWENAKISA